MIDRIIPDLEMMRTQIDTLFVLDSDNKLLQTNNLDDSPAPRLFLGRTRSGNLWRFRSDLSPECVKDIDKILRKEPPLKPKTLEDLPVYHDKILERMAAEAPVTRVWSGPAFYFPDLPKVPEGCVLITKFNMNLLQGALEPWSEDVEKGMPLMASLEDNKAVSLCGSVRQTEKFHEAGVETMTEYRNKGHATRVVSAWANHVAGLSVLPLYSTSWDNKISRKIIGRLGLRFYGTDYYLE